MKSQKRKVRTCGNCINLLKTGERSNFINTGYVYKCMKNHFHQIGRPNVLNCQDHEFKHEYDKN